MEEVSTIPNVINFKARGRGDKKFEKCSRENFRQSNFRKTMHTNTFSPFMYDSCVVKLAL